MTASNKSDRTRRAIIQAAAERFAADGYHGTSYRSLIEASGLSKGALYFHFPSKLDLALETYRTKQRELLAVSLSAGADEGAALERLFATLEARARAYVKDRSLRVLPRLSTDFARDPELAPVVRELHANAVSTFAELVRAAQEAGQIDTSLNAEAVARTIFATIVGMDEISERESGGRDLLERSREFLELLRRALAAPGERSRANQRR